MDNNIDKIGRLISKYIVANISNEELRELRDWLEASEINKQTFHRVTSLKNLESELMRRRMVDYHRPMHDMEARIGRLSTNVSQERGKGHSAGKRIAMLAAACAVVLIAVGIWAKMGNFFTGNSATDATSLDGTAQMGMIASVEDITHGETKAKLTLEDGTVIELDADQNKNREKMQKAAENQSLLSDVKTRNLNLSIPRGGEFKVTLEDGTEVWLNAESQLTYPEHFDKNERRVQIKGEAYFKVAKNAEKPFYVESAGQLIRVTGTEFNVNCYAEDQHVFTTLVSGSVALRSLNGEGGEVVLTPGHQAVFDKHEHKAQLRTVDTSVVTSWIKGSFVFEDQTLAQIMQDLSRWYNFHYQFMTPQAANTVFMGSVPRYGDFHDVLTILEKSGNLKFKIENSKLLIY